MTSGDDNMCHANPMQGGDTSDGAARLLQPGGGGEAREAIITKMTVHYIGEILGFDSGNWPTQDVISVTRSEMGNLLHVAESAIRDAILEEAVRATCRMCRDGFPHLEYNEHLGWLHIHPKKGPLECKASAIRSLQASPPASDEVAGPRPASEMLPPDGRPA